MRCCGSPTTSIARSGIDAAAKGEVATRFAALLFEQVFKPLAAPLGFYGDAAVAAASQAVARGERDGLAARLDRLIEDANR
jgi:hypothetical protein